MLAFNDSRFVCVVISIIDSARVDISETTLTFTSASCKFPSIDCFCATRLLLLSPAEFFASAAFLCITSARPAPSCARSAMFLAAYSISFVISSILLAVAAVSSMEAESWVVVVDTSSTSWFRRAISFVIPLTLSVVWPVSFFTSLINPPMPVLIFSKIFSSLPKSSLRFKAVPSIFAVKSPSDMLWSTPPTSFNGLVIFIIVAKRYTTIRAPNKRHTAKNTRIFCQVN